MPYQNNFNLNRPDADAHRPWAWMGNVVLSPEPEQRTLGVRHMVGTANCLGGIAALNYGVSVGVVDAQACRWLSLSALAVIGVFYTLLRSGLNKRLRDPSMASAQMTATVGFLAWGYFVGGPGRPIALMLLFVIMMFGMFTGTTRQLARASVIATLSFGAIMWQVAQAQRHVPHGPELQAVYFCVLLLVLGCMCALGWQLTQLRNQAARHQHALSEALKRIKELATRDVLTGLYNRRHMLELLNIEKHRSNRSGRHFCLALIDVDHFKVVNDQHGHGVGDEVLARLAATISEGLRETDAVARWGGEEFLILFTDTDSDAADKVLTRIHQALSQTVVSPTVPGLRISFSVGLTDYAQDELLTRTIDRADRALYAAKAGGRNRTVRWLPERAAA